MSSKPAASSCGGQNPFERVLALLQGVKMNGNGASARCPVPAHADTTASLSVSAGNDGRVLIYCHAGCTQEAVVAALGLRMGDLFPASGRGAGGVCIPPINTATPQHPQGCTLPQYAEAKRLPLDFLRSLGLTEIQYVGVRAVRIPYLDPQGALASTRFRVALEGVERFKWKSGARLIPYGLSRLHLARQRGYLVLVEGESDAQTLWHHDEPALGIPGASTWRDEWADYLNGIGTLYLLVEPDRGGETLRSKLALSSLRDRIHEFSLGSLKDPSGLYLDDPERFVERWEAAKSQSQPLAAVELAEGNDARERAWSLCAELARSSCILDKAAGYLRARGLVGEERTAKLLYLIVTSRFLTRPVSAAIKGPSSAGKSHLLQQVLDLHPPEAYFALSSMSERSLAYSKEPLSHRFLVLYEAAGLNKDFTSYLVRSLLSEGRLAYETVEKTKDGMKPRLIVREGPTGFLATTTLVHLHPENETRMLSLGITDSPEQTKAVLKSLAAGAGKPNDTEQLPTWHALQTWLRYGEHRVVIPYAEVLAEKVPPVAVRLRRDFGALLSLIQAHAILHQASRERGSDGCLLATLEDYARVRELVADLLAENLGATVAPSTRETVEKVDDLIGKSTSGDVSITALGDALGLDKSSASRRVRVAMDRGFLLNREERKGKPARLALGDPMPEAIELLPTLETIREALQCCSVDQGDTHPPSPCGGHEGTDGEA
jgi:hypothetical protein